MRSGNSYTSQLQRIANDFYLDTGRTTATKDEIARWAIRNNRWAPHPEANVKQCAEELARAMREDYETDSQGRRVRVKHAATFERNGRQATLWADVRNAPRQFMETAFRQRRQQIVGDCYQLKKDVDSYNQNQNTGTQILIPFDFTQDMAELEEMARMRNVSA